MAIDQLKQDHDWLMYVTFLVGLLRIYCQKTGVKLLWNYARIRRLRLKPIEYTTALKFHQRLKSLQNNPLMLTRVLSSLGQSLTTKGKN